MSWDLFFHPLLIVKVFLNDQMQFSKWSKHKQIAIGSFQHTNNLRPIYTVISDNKAKIIHSEASSSPTKWIINSHEIHNKHGQKNHFSEIERKMQTGEHFLNLPWSLLRAGHAWDRILNTGSCSCGWSKQNSGFWMCTPLTTPAFRLCNCLSVVSVVKPWL